MKEKILEILAKAGEKPVSGEEMATRLRVSRTAIWKHIGELKEWGYEIDSAPKNGYTLKKVPDVLIPVAIKSELTTKFIGREIIYRDSVGSTNDEAKKAAAAGAAEGTIVVAETQSAGRGRLSRVWQSPKGKGIWFSLILRPAFLLPKEAAKFTLLAAVATTRAMKKNGVAAGIKWPNDILARGKKLVGILTEMSAQVDGIDYIVVGIGINANLRADDFSPELKASATSVFLETGEAIRRAPLLAQILAEFEALYLAVKKSGFGEVTAAWREASLTLGTEVTVTGINETFSGKAKDIDDDGALIVVTDTGERRVLAGDVSIRKNSGGY